MLVELMPLPWSFEDSTHVPGCSGSEAEVGNEMQNSPSCDEVGSVCVVLNVADGFS